MEITLLGPLQASFAGRPIGLGPRKQRLLFAVLALEVNAHVSANRLVELLWPLDEPPPSARGMIHTYVSDLRKQLLTAGARDDGIWLDRQETGYQLRCEPQHIDAHRFDSLVAAARQSTDDQGRVLKLSDALSLWRGPVLAGITTEDVRTRLCSRLQEARITAIEDRVEALSRLGRHDGLLDTLLGLTAEHPMRPRLIGALMQELQRTGRATEALEIYRGIQQRMRDELGLDPPAPLRELQLALLRNEPIHAVPAATLNSTAPVPRQLPGDVPTFTGRADEVGQLLAADPFGLGPQQALVINAIDGMPGIGKTALAVHIAHRLADHYPDGQLFIDLHGYSEGTGPVEPGEALDRMLRALGVPGDQIPAKFDERATFYRSRLAGRRLLILLDNASGEHQVQHLLPGAPGCLVLITSRHRLTALDHTRTVSLDVLPLPDAVRLLICAAGEQRLTDQPPQLLAETVELCGRLPLAIRIAAARLSSHPAWSVAHLVDRLRERSHLLAELEAGQRSVAAALDLSVQQLSHDALRTYRLLGLHPGPDIDVHAAAALTDLTLIGVSRLLERLSEDHLLQEPAPGRYRFHDLVGAHAARLAAAEPDRGEALNRLLDHYAHCAATAMNQLYPPEAHQLQHTSILCSILDDPAKASAWLGAELPNLLATAYRAAGHGRRDYVLQLSTTLGRWLRVCGRPRDAETLHRLALDIARTDRDSDAELDALIRLGGAYRMQAKYDAGAEHLQEAVKIAQATGKHSAQLDALAGLARIHRMQGRYEQATECFEHVLTAASALDIRAAELEARLGLGWIDRLQHRYHQAASHLEQAQTIARAIGNRRAEADATNALGSLHRLQGRYELAIDHFELAKQIANAIGNHTAALIATFGLGSILHQLGQHEPAADQLRQALDLARTVGNRNWQFEAIHGLGRIHRATGRPDLALGCHHQALELAAGLDQPVDLARAHCGLAYANNALGEHELARQQWQRALDHLTLLGIDQTEDEETTTAAIHAHLSKLDS